MADLKKRQGLGTGFREMEQLSLFEENENNFINLKEASRWASGYLNRNVTVSNISYLVQYGKIKKYGSNGNTLIKVQELKAYYDAYDKEIQWKKKLGKDLNWRLSFVEYKESERTKHVHRLHPYKGKFIPQLVEYFLDSHTDEFRRQVFFKKGDIVLDPFCGSGTTLVQANELGMHSIGIDVSAFNSMISNTKVEKHDVRQLRETINALSSRLIEFQKRKKNIAFEEHLLSELSQFNRQFFPSPEYKRKVNKKEINEKKYGKDRENEFISVYDELVEEYGIKIEQDQDGSFLDRWFLFPVRAEIDFLFNELSKIENDNIKKVLSIILSRTVRSCRATTHADLATLKSPVTKPYYCKKHGKICKPIFSIKGWWERYSKDTLNRLQQFDRLRTGTYHLCLTGDSRTMDIFEETEKKYPEFGELIVSQKIKGIFSSPPYVGLINYHEQHAYSYEIFGFDRKDELEIGPLYKGQGKEARESYISGIAAVLGNCRNYLQEDYDIFLVANDKFNLYPDIARSADMKIVDRFKRPVLNRVEKDRSNAYAEIIFHLKEK